MDNDFQEKEQLKMKALPTGIKSIPKWIWFILIGSIMIISFGMDLLSTDYPTFVLIILVIIVVVSLVVLVIYVFYNNRKTLIKTCNNLINDYNTLLEKYETNEADLKGKIDDLLEAKEKTTILETETKQLQKELVAKSGELDSTQEKLKETEKELKSTESKLTEIEGELKSIRDEFEKSKKQLDETEKKLETTKENLDLRENELASTREELTLTKDEFKRTNEYLDKIEKELHHRRTSEVKPIFSSGANRYNHWVFWNKYKIWIKNVGNGAAKNVVGRCIYHTASEDHVMANISEETFEVNKRIVLPSIDEVGNDKDYPPCESLSVEFNYVDIYGNQMSYRNIFVFD